MSDFNIRKFLAEATLSYDEFTANQKPREPFKPNLEPAGCPTCHGSGKIDNNDTCHNCGGKGEIFEGGEDATRHNIDQLQTANWIAQDIFDSGFAARSQSMLYNHINDYIDQHYANWGFPGQYRRDLIQKAIEHYKALLKAQWKNTPSHQRGKPVREEDEPRKYKKPSEEEIAANRAWNARPEVSGIQDRGGYETMDWPTRRKEEEEVDEATKQGPAPAAQVKGDETIGGTQVPGKYGQKHKMAGRLVGEDATDEAIEEIKSLAGLQEDGYDDKVDPEDVEWDAHWAAIDGDEERARDLEWDAHHIRNDQIADENKEYTDQELIDMGGDTPLNYNDVTKDKEMSDAWFTDGDIVRVKSGEKRFAGKVGKVVRVEDGRVVVNLKGFRSPEIEFFPEELTVMINDSEDFDDEEDVMLAQGDIVDIDPDLGGEAQVVAVRDRIIVVKLGNGKLKVLPKNEVTKQDLGDDDYDMDGEYADVSYDEEEPDELDFNEGGKPFWTDVGDTLNKDGTVGGLAKRQGKRAGKWLKRGMSGWDDGSDPIDMMKKHTEYDTDTLKRLRNKRAADLAGQQTKAKSPADLQQKLIKRNLRKRGEHDFEKYMDEGYEEITFENKTDIKRKVHEAMTKDERNARRRERNAAFKASNERFRIAQNARRREARNKYKYTTAKKHGGDDAYSWAIFNKATGQTVVTGLTKSEVKYHRDKIEAMLSKKAVGEGHSTHKKGYKNKGGGYRVPGDKDAKRAGAKFARKDAKQKAKDDVEEDLHPYGKEDGNYQDGDWVDDESGQIFRGDEVEKDPDTGKMRVKPAPKWEPSIDQNDDPWGIGDTSPEYDPVDHIKKLGWDAIGDFGDVAGGGGDPIDFIMQKYDLSIEDIDAEAVNQGYKDAYEWAGSYTDGGEFEEGAMDYLTKGKVAPDVAPGDTVDTEYGNGVVIDAAQNRAGHYDRVYVEFEDGGKKWISIWNVKPGRSYPDRDEDAVHPKMGPGEEFLDEGQQYYIVDLKDVIQAGPFSSRKRAEAELADYPNCEIKSGASEMDMSVDSSLNELELPSDTLGADREAPIPGAQTGVDPAQQAQTGKQDSKEELDRLITQLQDPSVEDALSDIVHPDGDPMSPEDDFNTDEVDILKNLLKGMGNL